MTKSVAGAFSILRAVLLSSVAFGLAGSGAALARVGVTSATNGDPLGKPPQEAERVLRIGIDVQANEVIRTGPNDRAHLVFLDGTALTVGPNAQLTIDKFVYDPDTKIGEIAISASQGVLRLVGGRISKTDPIVITTPSSTIGIRGGICVLSVQQLRTISTFLFGSQMTVRAGGHEQHVTRPGSQVSTNAGSAPGAPTLVGSGGLAAQLAQLEGGAGGGGGNNNSGGGNADRGAGNFSHANSGQPPGGTPPTGNGTTPPNQNILSNNPGANPNSGTNGISTTFSQKVIVTNGRYLGDPAYTNFNRTDLSVTPNAANNKTIDSSGTVKTATVTATTSGGTTTASASSLTLNVPGSGTIALPWITNTLDSGFSIGSFTALGQTLTDGMGYVSPNGEFFAYIFKSNGNTVGVFGGTPTTPTGTANFPTSGVAAFSMGNFGSSGCLPFADSTVGDDTQLQNAKSVSKLYAAYSTALTQTVGVAPPDARATALQAAISISGTGANQKSNMGVFIGTFFRDVTTTGGTVTTDNGMALSGHFSASYRLGATQQIGRLVSAESTPLTGNGNAIYGTASGDGAATGIILTPDKLTSTATVTGGVVSDVTTTRTSQASFDQPYTNLPGQDYFSVNAAYKATTPTNLGVTKTTQTLNGFVGGVAEQLDSSGNFSTRVVTTSDPSTLTLNTNASNNRASVDVTVGNWDTSTSATFHLGGTTGGNDASSAFIDNTQLRRARSHDDHREHHGDRRLRLERHLEHHDGELQRGAGGHPLQQRQRHTLHLRLHDPGARGAVTSATPTAAPTIPAAAMPQFATYVAGTLSVASDINALNLTATTTARWSATSSTAATRASRPAATRRLELGNRSGVVTATFDGTTYGGGVTANTVMTGGATFGTNGTAITAGGRSLTLNGAFFSGGTSNPVAGQGEQLRESRAPPTRPAAPSLPRSRIPATPAPFCCAGDRGNRGRIA